MAGVFQNIDPPSPSPPGECVPPPPRLWCGGGTHSLGGKGGWGVNILEDVRHSSVLYVCKFFVGETMIILKGERLLGGSCRQEEVGRRANFNRKVFRNFTSKTKGTHAEPIYTYKIEKYISLVCPF
jgi:hypothetical protein